MYLVDGAHVQYTVRQLGSTKMIAESLFGFRVTDFSTLYLQVPQYSTELNHGYTQYSDG